MAGNVPAEDRLVLTGAVTLQSAEATHAQFFEMAGQPVSEIDCSGATEAVVWSTSTPRSCSMSSRSR
jgi:hypothetical protein